MRDVTNFDTSKWLTTGQAASYLKLAPGTLQNWRSKGKGPKFIKRGNNVYYPMKSLEDYIARHTNLFGSTAQWKTQN